MGMKKIAIACQGGGTHAAFTWGVLTKILETKKAWDAGRDRGDTFDVVAVSGTSAGALCALATWYGLVPNKRDPQCGTIDKAIERLNFLWTTFSASTPVETAQNLVVGALLDMREKGAPFPGSNPNSPINDLMIASLSLLGARQQYLSFPSLLQSVCPHFQDIDWPAVAGMRRRILAGAIEIFSGNFEVFDSNKTLEELGLRTGEKESDQYNTTRWRMRRSISLEGVAASGTLPEVLPAQRIGNLTFPACQSKAMIQRDGFYWDGLYSQNPPVRQFFDVEDKEEKPDEIWVVRINPQENDRNDPLSSLEDIRDRENELAGNLSLNQELDHIMTMNRWVKNHGAANPWFKDRKLVEVRTIKMRRETAWGLRRTSKFDRSPGHLERLYREGLNVADEWLAGWRERGLQFDAYPDDARYPESL